jgi:hypothetical protein
MGWFRRFRTQPPWRWAMWIVLTAVWTIMLVMPVPEDDRWPLPTMHGAKYYLGKSLHFGVYALLTVLAGWLHPRFRWRLLLLFFLMAHAGLTEWLQLRVSSNRTGTVDDVVLDHIGIALGLAVSWKWWARDP